MEWYKGRAWVSLGGVGYVELSEEFFGLIILQEFDLDFQSTKSKKSLVFA